MHQTTLIVTLALLLALAAAFIIAIRGSFARQPAGDAAAATARIRSPLLWGLLAFGVFVTAATLRPWPHAVASVDKPIIVSLTGSQWSWDFKPKQVPVGKPIVFAVTSTDVNHGVGIYDPDGRLLTQTQGMPGYINRVQFTFTKPGTYRLLCLEYCGLAHHDMIDQLKVVSN